MTSKSLLEPPRPCLLFQLNTHQHSAVRTVQWSSIVLYQPPTFGSLTVDESAALAVLGTCCSADLLSIAYRWPKLLVTRFQQSLFVVEAIEEDGGILWNFGENPGFRIP